MCGTFHSSGITANAFGAASTSSRTRCSIAAGGGWRSDFGGAMTLRRLK
jgi:hypothetical protein